MYELYQLNNIIIKLQPITILKKNNRENYNTNKVCLIQHQGDRHDRESDTGMFFSCCSPAHTRRVDSHWKFFLYQTGAYSL